MVDTKSFATTEFGEETLDECLMWEETSFLENVGLNCPSLDTTHL